MRINQNFIKDEPDATPSSEVKSKTSKFAHDHIVILVKFSVRLLTEICIESKPSAYEDPDDEGEIDESELEDQIPSINGDLTKPKYSSTF